MGCVIMLLILACHAYTFSIGLRAWQRAQKCSGEASQTFRFIALNLCEPLINTFLILVLSLLLLASLFFHPSTDQYIYLLLTLPMAVLLLPVQGIHFQNPLYRKVNRQLLLLGLARWGLNVLIISSAIAFEHRITAVSIPIAVLLYFMTIDWDRNVVNTLYGSTITSTPPQKTLSNPQTFVTPPPQLSLLTNTAISAPTSTTSRTTTTQLQLPDLSTAIWCPVCHTPTALDADHCHLCGLVFASRLPFSFPIPSHYTLIRPLATGGMSHIYLARDTTTDQLVVLKTLASIDAPQPTDWRTDARTCLAHEATLLQSLDHPGLPHVHTWRPDEHNPLLVLEHIVGPTLEQAITTVNDTGQLVGTQPLPVAEALDYAHGVTQTLIYLADQPQPIIHGDLKPANLIAATDRSIPVLLDFGSAARLEEDDPTTLSHRYGTPGFAAPEQYQGQVTSTSDVYGLGATLYRLLTADDPSSHPLHFPALTTLPPNLADLLTTMLDRDPDRRPPPSALEVQLHRTIIHNIKHNEAMSILK